MRTEPHHKSRLWPIRAASRALCGSLSMIQPIYRTSFSPSESDVAADGYAINTIAKISILHIRYKSSLIQVVDLKSDRRAAGDLHNVDNSHHLAVVKCSRSFQEDLFEVYR